jgi:hypothetical protein
MYSAPANNPMATTSADPNECIWGEESQRDQEPAATAPPLTMNPPQSPREHSKEMDQTEQRQQLSWKTPPLTRNLFTSQDPPPIVHSSSKPRLSEQPSTLSRRHTTRDSSPEEENTRRLIETIGYVSITDTAFALQPFTGSTHSGESAEKWLEKCRRYVAFKKISEPDQLQLHLHLLMRDLLMEKYADKLLKANLVGPCKSARNALAILMKKAEFNSQKASDLSQWRLVLDYRRLTRRFLKNLCQVSSSDARSSCRLVSLVAGSAENAYSGPHARIHEATRVVSCRKMDSNRRLMEA